MLFSWSVVYMFLNWGIVIMGFNIGVILVDWFFNCIFHCVVVLSELSKFLVNF